MSYLLQVALYLCQDLGVGDAAQHADGIGPVQLRLGVHVLHQAGHDDDDLVWVRTDLSGIQTSSDQQQQSSMSDKQASIDPAWRCSFLAEIAATGCSSLLDHSTTFGHGYDGLHNRTQSSRGGSIAHLLDDQKHHPAQVRILALVELGHTEKDICGFFLQTCIPI